MKITVKQYATSLLEITAGKTKSELDLLLANFAKILKANNDLNKAAAIIKELQTQWLAADNTLSAEIISARELTPETLKTINQYLLTASQAEKIIWQKSLNPKIVGGAIIRYKDKLLDISVKNQLNKLKEKMTA